jgi:hypothetical protein
MLVCVPETSTPRGPAVQGSTDRPRQDLSRQESRVITIRVDATCARYTGWDRPIDHTSNQGETRGRMLVCVPETSTPGGPAVQGSTDRPRQDLSGPEPRIITIRVDDHAIGQPTRMKNCIKMESIPSSRNPTIAVLYQVSLTVNGRAKVDVGTSAAIPFHTTQTMRHRSAATGIGPERE